MGRSETRHSRPAAVIGAGPNGLAAAVTLARAGIPVTVFESADTIGGGTRTTEIVMPGVRHDVCAAIHPLAIASGFFHEFELTRRVEFTMPEVSYAHTLRADRTEGAAIAYRDLNRTAEGLGRDGAAYRQFYRPLLRQLDDVIDFTLGPTMLRLPRHPLAALAVGLRSLEQGTPLWGLRFRDEAAPALISGVAAHSISRMPRIAPAAVGAVLGALAHAGGWPVPVGGSQVIADALAAEVIALGGEIRIGHEVSDLRELSAFGTVLFDTSARDLARIAGAALPRDYVRRLQRFAYGDGAAKVDYVLDGPIPWRDPRIAAAPTVHVGGTRAEIAATERMVSRGRHPAQPYVLLSQLTAFDPDRNPPGTHAIWSYTHVPAGSTVDMGERVTAQIERFAPGFRDRIVGMHVTTAQQLARYNANYPGGDFSAGAITMRQLLARPTLSRDPHRTPAAGVYLASSSAAPGPGVHGLAGWYAARSALRHEYGIE